MKIGITGHQDLPPEASRLLVSAVAELFSSIAVTRGIGSLAAGADQLFADNCVRRAIPIEVVIPCAGYETVFGDDITRSEYRRLLNHAERAIRIPFPEPSEAAFLAAGLVVAERCDMLIACWDGKPAAGLGGTGDIAAYARDIGRDTRVVWPNGVER